MVNGEAPARPRVRAVFWRAAFALALIVAAVVSGFMERAVPWPRALLYGGGAALLILGLALMVEDFAWWGVRLLRALRRLRP